MEVRDEVIKNLSRKNNGRLSKKRKPVNNTFPVLYRSSTIVTINIFYIGRDFQDYNVMSTINQHCPLCRRAISRDHILGAVVGYISR